MRPSRTQVVASTATLALTLSAGCFSSDTVSSPNQTDASLLDGTTPSGDSSPGEDSATGSEDAGSGVDATIDAGPEAGPSVADAAKEAAAEASVDAAVEASVDVSVDAGVDADVDANAVDAGVDAAPEAGTVAVSTTNTQVITLGDTATLFIYDNHGVWSYHSATQVAYANLPPALIGTVGNDTVNTSTPVTFTLTKTTTCYLLRQDNWTGVDMTGWVAFDHAAYYFTGYEDNSFGPGTIYTQTFPAGVYNWNTYSAMYACAE